MGSSSLKGGGEGAYLVPSSWIYKRKEEEERDAVTKTRRKSKGKIERSG